MWSEQRDLPGGETPSVWAADSNDYPDRESRRMIGAIRTPVGVTSLGHNGDLFASGHQLNGVRNQGQLRFVGSGEIERPFDPFNDDHRKGQFLQRDCRVSRIVADGVSEPLGLSNGKREHPGLDLSEGRSNRPNASVRLVGPVEPAFENAVDEPLFFAGEIDTSWLPVEWRSRVGHGGRYHSIPRPIPP